MIRTLFLSVVPSPYQRDIFRALARRKELDIKVCYMEGECPGYPWPLSRLEAWESVLPGRKLSLCNSRIHFHTGLPIFSEFDVTVLNMHLSSLTTQYVMRHSIAKTKWVFWGERLRHQKAGWKKAIQNLLAAPLRNSTAIAAIGTLANKDYSERFPKGRVFNIPYHCNLEAFVTSPHHEGNSDEVTFLFCGVMNRRKGVDLLINAFNRLIKSGAKARLNLVGQEGDLRSFMKDIDPRTKSLIHYDTFKAPDELPGLFSQSDVFVLPSRHDGWGVVVNQALGAGLPVICSDGVGAGFDLVELEKNGLRFANENEEALFACLKRFVDEPEICSKWGEVSRGKAIKWSPEAGAAKWVEVLSQVMIPHS